MKTVTANRLRDGIAVYYTGSSWSERVAEAAAREDKAEIQVLLESALVDEKNNFVVAPYVIEVVEEKGHWFPKDKKERVRAVGPSVREDLGREHV